MFAVVKIAGFQEMVEEGDTIEVPTLASEKGKSMTFDQVLMVSDGDSLTFGAPVIDGAIVEGKVVEHGRGDKIRVVKFRRRKRYLRVKGHRQGYTTIQITKIKLK